MLINVLRSLRAREPRNPLVRAQACLAERRFAEAIELATTAIEAESGNPHAYLLRAKARFMVGEHEAAETDRRRAGSLLSLPEAAELFHDAALDLWQMGNRDNALTVFSWAQISDSTYVPAQRLPGIEVQGEWYLHVMARIQAHLRPRNYLEIGVAMGDSIKLALPDTIAVGVDPEPRIQGPVSPHWRIFPQTSDSFFAGEDVPALLGGRPLELGFIDGMHRFEFALRDFVNMERLCTPASTILVHDCYPATRETAERERSTHFWSGDVWRLIMLLKKHRPDLSVHTIAAPPTGLALIRALDPASRVLAQKLDSIVEEYLALDYSVLDRDKAAQLNLVPNDWSRIAALLGR